MPRSATRRVQDRKAWIYTSKHRDPDGAPSQFYYDGVIEGLIDLGAPDWYLEKVMADAQRRFDINNIKTGAPNRQLMLEPEWS